MNRDKWRLQAISFEHELSKLDDKDRKKKRLEFQIVFDNYMIRPSNGEFNFADLEFPCAISFNKVQFADNKNVNFLRCVFHGNVSFLDTSFGGSETNFQGTIFYSEMVRFTRTSFGQKGVDFSSVNLCTATFIFENLQISGKANFVNTKIRKSKSKTDANHISFRNTKFIDCDVNFWGANFRDVPIEFVGVTFGYQNKTAIMIGDSRVSLTQSVLNYASFIGTNLRGAKFEKADISNASFVGAHFDVQTSFKGCNVGKCRVDRFALECLNDYGGLSVGDRMGMQIHDDVAALRSSYSGFMQVLHIVALAGFLYPYLWFVLSAWIKAKFMPVETSTIALWEAVGRFIYNGGVNWQAGWEFQWSFLVFLTALLYNALRVMLLVKTKNLELAERTSGLPQAFNLNNLVYDGVFLEKKIQLRWRHLLSVSKYSFYLYLMAVLYNFIHFSTMRIPI